MRRTFSALGVVAFLGLGAGCVDNAARVEDTQKTCTDGEDNDKDGLIDCDDHDCKTLEQCKGNTGGETCGNAKLDPEEKCDTKIPDGQPGSCPARCDDGVACTADGVKGAGTCAAVCASEPTTACKGGDACCPQGCDAKSDSDCSGSCGNGGVEPPEKCDTKIAEGQPGACPSSCDDGASCTEDKLLNAGSCDAVCAFTAITACKGGDGCCPTGCDAKSDSDCSPTCGNGTVEPPEQCDTKIPSGQSGACPTGCDDGNACTQDTLLNPGTCGATCTSTAVTQCKGGDGCCPSGCNALSDGDCSATCGNGTVEPPEKCDTKVAAGQPGACPTACDDGNSCTQDKLLNGGTCAAGCSQSAITQCRSGDGCCPVGCNARSDSDCSPSCGNGVVEVPERCDTKIPVGQVGACPTSCNDQNACTQDTLLNGGTCAATCNSVAITQCKAGDGCCPTGCNALSDADCSASCGNGVVEPPEKCDTKIPAGQSGACPTRCDDGSACTQDALLNGGTCAAQCSSTVINQCKAGDGCCPVGCNALSDTDCSPTCGNAVVEPPEKCDTKIPVGQAGACPVGCNDQNVCTQDTLLNGGTCSATCNFSVITQCKGGDGCCPVGCNAVTDGDCSPTCGNGVVEPPEVCDIKIPIGQAGACPVGCNDQNVCTQDTLLNGGTCAATCSYTTITQCQAGDGCCPVGCNANTDSDCTSQCGNGVLEPKELCDTAIPPTMKGSCPTACTDGNVCTTDLLLNPGTCLAQCSFTVITQCQAGDGCCPPGCNAATDGDCAAVCGNGVLEPTEKCDIKIPPTSVGACPQGCGDQNVCTTDTLLNPGTCQAQCVYTPITQCQSGDGCCPSGCYKNTDSDCAACAPGTHDCNGKCVSDCFVGSCGSLCVTCPAPAYATPACVNCKACDFTCGPGREKCPASPTQCRLTWGDGSDGAFNTNDYPSDGTRDIYLPLGITRNARSFVVNTDASPRYGTYNFKSIYVALGDTLTGVGTRPVILRSTEGLTLSGAIDVSGLPGKLTRTGSAPGGAGGPGAGAGGAGLVNCCQGSTGGGIGGGGGANTLAASTSDCVCGIGCGGSFATVGGSADYGKSGCRAGATYAFLDGSGSLRGGSGGGGAGANQCTITLAGSSGGGGGGGALRIVTAGSIYIASGTIASRGGVGGSAAGGGGSGGAIELVARGTIINNGLIIATGAAGWPGAPSSCQGALQGGDGVIAIYTASGMSGNGKMSPTPTKSDGLPSGCEK
ncbi:MAG: hypothetical protein IT371_11795 [Deltaproteobacteria bacterium]|nr:hypothetical protein [Deltaproteobacteria bacterium]